MQKQVSNSFINLYIYSKLQHKFNPQAGLDNVH